MTICPILSNYLVTFGQMILISAFKVFSLASMVFVKNGGKKGGSLKRQADNHKTLYHC